MSFLASANQCKPLRAAWLALGFCELFLQLSLPLLSFLFGTRALLSTSFAAKRLLGFYFREAVLSLLLLLLLGLLLMLMFS